MVKENLSETENFKKSKLNSLFLQGVFFSFSSAILSYVLSSYIEEYIGSNYVSIIYLIPNIITIFLIFHFGKIIKKIGIYTAYLLDIVLLFFSLFLEVFSDHNIFYIVFLLIVYQTTMALSWIFIDYYIEKYSSDSSTGNTKGIQWTTINLTFLFGPLLAGFLVSHFGYSPVFFLSSIMIIPPLIFIVKGFKNIKIVREENTKINLRKIHRNKAVWKISIMNFLLNFFYCWMTIFTPLYMNKVLNLTWDKIGIIMSIVLIPFIIFQYPAGKVADKYLGEKELLMISTLILGVSTIALFFVKNVFWFTLILFLTRIGASILEIIREVYLYKNLDASNIDLISFYKLVSPLSWVIGPVLSSILLNIFDMKYLFLILGIIILVVGIPVLWNLKDTKINFKSKIINF